MQGDEVVQEGAEEEFEEMAWGEVNNIPLPIEMVKKARSKDMQHMKDNIFKVDKKEEA